MCSFCMLKDITTSSEDVSDIILISKLIKKKEMIKVGYPILVSSYKTLKKQI